MFFDTAEVELERQQQCTFHPKINKKRRNVQETEESRQERFTRLAYSRRNSIAQREREKIRLEKEQMAACTFFPNTKASRRASNAHLARARSPERNAANAGKITERVALETVERLHHEADTRAMNREKLRMDMEKQQIESFPCKWMCK